MSSLEQLMVLMLGNRIPGSRVPMPLGAHQTGFLSGSLLEADRRGESSAWGFDNTSSKHFVGEV